MSYRDLLQQRRQGASVPCVPVINPITGTEKNHIKQHCSLSSRCTRQNTTREQKAAIATPVEVETIIDGLKAAGRRLGTVEVLIRLAMLKMSREAAAELAVAVDDAFAVATSGDTARAQCRRLLNDQQVLEAAKAVWPSLPPAVISTTRAVPRTPVVDHAPQWLRLIRDNCPLAPEDERLLSGSLAMRAPNEALEAAKQYVITWKHAASIEPREAARDNAGRRAANNELRGGNRHAR